MRDLVDGEPIVIERVKEDGDDPLGFPDHAVHIPPERVTGSDFSREGM